MAANVVRDNTALLAKAERASQVLGTDDLLSLEARQLDDEIGAITNQILRAKETYAMTVVAERFGVIQRQSRLLENNILAARQRLSVAKQVQRRLQDEFSQAARGVELQGIVSGQMEKEMGAIRDNIYGQVDRFEGARRDIDKLRDEFVPLQESADKEVERFGLDWKCLKNFDDENPAIIQRSEIYNEIRILCEESVRSRHSAMHKLMAMQVEANLQLSRNRTRIREHHERINQLQSIFNRLYRATSTTTPDELCDRFNQSHDRQLEMLSEVDTLVDMRSVLESDLTQLHRDNRRPPSVQIMSTDDDIVNAPPPTADQLRRQIEEQTLEIERIDLRHLRLSEELEQTAEYLLEHFANDDPVDVESVDGRLEIGAAALHSHTLAVLSRLGRDRRASFVATNGSCNPGSDFSVLSTKEDRDVPDPALKLSENPPVPEKIHDRETAGRLFIKALLDQLHELSAS